MRIVLAVPSLDSSYGGPSYTVRKIYNALLKRSEISELKIITESNRSNYDAHLFMKLPLDQIDLVHIFGIWTPFNHRIIRLAKAKGIPYIVTPMGMLEPWALAQKKYKKKLALLLYQKADLLGASVIHATSDMEMRNLKNLNINKHIQIIPHGIDLNHTSSSYIDQDFVKPKCILFLSRIHKKKGIEELVEACAKIQPSGWRVLMAGPGEKSYIKKILSRVKELGLSDKFLYLGEVLGPEKEAAYKMADLFVLPTFSENFGVVVAESLAHGVPVITTDQSPWSGIVDNSCGWYIPTGVEPLVDALNEALNMDKQALQAMGNSGMKWVGRDFNWELIISQHINLYKNVLYGNI